MKENQKKVEKLWNEIKTSKNWKLFFLIGIVSLVILNLTGLIKAILAIVGIMSLVYSAILAYPVLSKKLK